MPLFFSFGSSPCAWAPRTCSHVRLRQLFQFLPLGVVDVLFPSGFGHARLIHFFLTRVSGSQLPICGIWEAGVASKSVKLQRSARATACSHSVRDVTASVGPIL